MTRNWFARVIGGSLVAGLFATLVLVAANQTAHGGDTATAVIEATAGADQDSKQRDLEKEARKDRDRGGALGPPPWAHAQKQHGQIAKGHPDKDWKDAWQKLTAPQREQKMVALAKAHAKGMQKWADCVAAAHGDATKRASCEKPLPPGLAKRLP